MGFSLFDFTFKSFNTIGIYLLTVEIKSNYRCLFCVDYNRGKLEQVDLFFMNIY